MPMATADAITVSIVDPLDVETPDGYELIDGQLREKTMSRECSWIATQILGILWTHCRQTGAGEAFTADTAYRCFPGRPKHARKPDVSFISRERLPAVPTGPGDFTLSPDLVVEVCSPNETVRRIKGKLKDWRSVTVPVIWIIEPESRTATAYVGNTVHELGEHEDFPVGDILSGFRLKLADVLLPPATAEAAP
jgi:Uma2 family endonuclease